MLARSAESKSVPAQLGHPSQLRVSSGAQGLAIAELCSSILNQLLELCIVLAAEAPLLGDRGRQARPLSLLIVDQELQVRRRGCGLLVI